VNNFEKRWPITAAQLFILISLLGAVSGAGCRRTQPPENALSESGAGPTLTSSIPPFSTKEPDRYQAIRIVTFSERSPGGPTAQERITRVLIARDGERRREEYLDGVAERFVYLELPAGQFVLIPSSSLYADAGVTATPNESESEEKSSVVSPGLLLNENSRATYENLGGVMLDGRMTTKYRVTPADGNNNSTTKVETLIWIDESIGMPVRSETTSSAAEHSSKVTMELQDIKLEVDERLFALPASYRKVEARLILDKIHAVR